MGKGRAPSSFDYFIMNLNNKKRQEGKTHSSIQPDSSNRFNIDGHIYYRSGLNGKMIKIK